MLKPTPIRKSMDGMCALSTSCFPIGPKNSSKRTWIKDKDLYLGDISGYKRVVAAVYLLTDENKKPYIMDCVTGTLYRVSDGSCLSSDTLKLKKFTKEEGLDKLLMKVKSEQYTGGVDENSI